MQGYFRAKGRHNTETLTVHLYGTSLSNVTPSNNTARPAESLEGGVQGALRGGHALAIGRAKKRRALAERVI